MTDREKIERILLEWCGPRTDDPLTGRDPWVLPLLELLNSDVGVCGWQRGGRKFLLLSSPDFVRIHCGGPGDAWVWEALKAPGLLPDRPEDAEPDVWCEWLLNDGTRHCEAGCLLNTRILAFLGSGEFVENSAQCN